VNDRADTSVTRVRSVRTMRKEHIVPTPDSPTVSGGHGGDPAPIELPSVVFSMLRDLDVVSGVRVPLSACF
jgi:hypothetical protein